MTGLGPNNLRSLQFFSLLALHGLREPSTASMMSAWLRDRGVMLESGAIRGSLVGAADRGFVDRLPPDGHTDGMYIRPRDVRFSLTPAGHAAILETASLQSRIAAEAGIELDGVVPTDPAGKVVSMRPLGVA